MPNPRELRNYIRFQLQNQLSAENGAHTFEHICREVARRRIASNVIPATGPVGAGGDEGCDFETYKSYLAALGEHRAFVALVSDKALAFACTLQQEKVPQKFADDVKSIAESGHTFDRIYGMCAVNMPVGHRKRLKRQVKKAHGLELEVMDGPWIADQLADPDLFWVAESYLAVPKSMGPSRAAPSSVVEDRSTGWTEPPRQKKYVEMQVGFGKSPDEPDSFRTLADIVEEQRGLAERGERDEAFEALAALALEMHEWGLSEVALEVLDDLHEVVPPGTVNPAQDAWLLNTRALALSRLGKAEEADALWHRMLSVGEHLQDQELRAIALQNLATSDVNAGRLQEAKERVRESFPLMRELGRTRSMVQLLNNLALINIDQKRYEEATSQLDAYEEMAGAVGDLHLLVSARGNRGRLLIRQERFAEAEVQFREALKLARKIGDPVREVLGLQNMGAVCVDQGRPGDGVRWYRKGIRLAVTYNLPVQIEVLLRSLATALHVSGRHAEAIGSFDDARQAAWKLGDKHLWGQSTMNIGAVYVVSGDGDAAIDPLTRAASTFRELGEFEWEIRTRRNMAVAYKSIGEPEAAVIVLEKALPLLGEDDHEQRAELLNQEAHVCLEDSRLRGRAVSLFELAGAEQRAFQKPDESARRSADVASLLRDAGSDDEALSFLDTAVATPGLGSGTDEEYGRADALNDRAIMLNRLRRHEDAQRDLLQCIELTDQSGDKRLRQKALANLAEVERHCDEPARAVETARSAVAAARELDDDAALAHAIENLGLALEDNNELDDADTAWSELARLGEASQKPRWQELATQGRARAAFIRGDYQEAAALYGGLAATYDDGNDKSIVFALGGLLESLSCAGVTDGLEEAAQRLVDHVQTDGNPETAITYFGRGGISWMKHGRVDEGVSLLSLAVQLGVRFAVARAKTADDESAETDDAYRPLFEAVCFAVFAARAGSIEETAVYEALVSALACRDARLAELVRPLLGTAREAMAGKDEDVASTTRHGAPS